MVTTIVRKVSRDLKYRVNFDARVAFGNGVGLKASRTGHRGLPVRCQSCHYVTPVIHLSLVAPGNILPAPKEVLDLGVEAG